MTDALVQFLRARLDEDEQAAAASSDGPWTAWRGKALLHGLGQLEHAVVLPGEGVGSRASIVTASWMDAEHIARHHPARILAEVTAKRCVISLYELAVEHGQTARVEAYGDALRLFTLSYVPHPDFQQEWAPDQA
jgi:hypothetical protein